MLRSLSVDHYLNVYKRTQTSTLTVAPALTLTDSFAACMRLDNFAVSFIPHLFKDTCNKTWRSHSMVLSSSCNPGDCSGIGITLYQVMICNCIISHPWPDPLQPPRPPWALMKNTSVSLKAWKKQQHIFSRWLHRVVQLLFVWYIVFVSKWSL